MVKKGKFHQTMGVNKNETLPSCKNFACLFCGWEKERSYSYVQLHFTVIMKCPVMAQVFIYLNIYKHVRDQGVFHTNVCS